MFLIDLSKEGILPKYIKEKLGIGPEYKESISKASQTPIKITHIIIHFKLLPTLNMHKVIKIINCPKKRLVVNTKLMNDVNASIRIALLASSKLNDALLNSCDKGVSFRKSFLA